MTICAIFFQNKLFFIIVVIIMLLARFISVKFHIDLKNLVQTYFKETNYCIYKSGNNTLY